MDAINTMWTFRAILICYVMTFTFVLSLPDCPTGMYGENCDKKCGFGCNNYTCDKRTGICECFAGWMPPLCAHVCQAGFHGQNCLEQCGHCKSSDGCNPETAECSTGCKTGYSGLKCKTAVKVECTYGTYGKNCSQVCGVGCVRSTCDAVSGECDCLPGFQPPRCNKVCHVGSFGQNCSKHCGHCRSQSKCLPENGICLTGCKTGYKGPLCITIGKVRQSEPLGIEMGNTVIYIAIFGVGIIIISTIIISAATIHRSLKKQAKLAQLKQHAPGALNDDGHENVYENTKSNVNKK